jgi:transposase
MANKTVSMLRIRKLIQLLDDGLSQRQISAELKMGRNIVANYVRQIHECGQSIQSIQQQDDESLASQFCHSSPKPSPDERFQKLEQNLPDWIEELKKTGMTKLQLWKEYMAKYPEGYGYTQFKEHLNFYIKNHSYAYHNEHMPAKEMYVDFAGSPLYITDKRTNQKQSCPVLICTLPCSNNLYVMALHDMRQESLYFGLSSCLSYFGGVPESVLSDNMRQWVKRADRYEPTMEEAMLSWGTYYHTEITAARVRKPRDKGDVECHVNIAYHAIYAPMRNEIFYSLDALNARIQELLYDFNRSKMQGRSYSRHDDFMEREASLLRPLPPQPYVFKYRKVFTVNSTYHVQLVADRHFYSVPYQYVGHPATMVYDYLNVEIYVGLERIASHRRAYDQGGYSTLEEHMPPNHLAYKRSREYNAEYYLRKSAAIGPSTKEVVDRILGSHIFVQQAYRSCQGILSLIRHYPEGRVEAACSRAKQSPTVSYQMVKQILEKKLDTVEEKQKCQERYIPDHENIRGADAYK